MADYCKNEVAYDYDLQAWVEGSEAVPLLVEQCSSELDTLRDNGLDYLDFRRPANRKPATEADVAAAIRRAEAALAYWRRMLDDDEPPF